MVYGEGGDHLVVGQVLVEAREVHRGDHALVRDGPRREGAAVAPVLVEAPLVRDAAEAPSKQVQRALEGRGARSRGLLLSRPMTRVVTREDEKGKQQQRQKKNHTKTRLEKKIYIYKLQHDRS